MPPIDIDEINEAPVRYWKANRELIHSGLASGNEPTRQRASYAFVKAAKEGHIRGVTEDFATTVQHRIRGQESIVQTNVVGGVAAILIQSGPRQIRSLFSPLLVEQLAKVGDNANEELGLNSMIGLSKLSFHWPDQVGTKQTVNSAVSHVTLDRSSVERTKATYAAMLLANIGRHKPRVFDGGLSSLRKGMTLDVSDRQFAALAYCLQRAVDSGIGVDNGSRALRHSIKSNVTDMLMFASDEKHAPGHRAIVLESIVPICERMPSAVPTVKIVRIAESILENEEEETPMVLIAAKNLLESLPNTSLEVDQSFVDKILAGVRDQLLQGDIIGAGVGDQLRQGKRKVSQIEIENITFAKISDCEKLIYRSPNSRIG